MEDIILYDKIYSEAVDFINDVHRQFSGELMSHIEDIQRILSIKATVFNEKMHLEYFRCGNIINFLKAPQLAPIERNITFNFIAYEDFIKAKEGTPLTFSLELMKSKFT